MERTLVLRWRLVWEDGLVLKDGLEQKCFDAEGRVVWVLVEDGPTPSKPE